MHPVPMPLLLITCSCDHVNRIARYRFDRNLDLRTTKQIGSSDFLELPYFPHCHYIDVIVAGSGLVESFADADRRLVVFRKNFPDRCVLCHPPAEGSINGGSWNGASSSRPMECDYAI